MKNYISLILFLCMLLLLSCNNISKNEHTSSEKKVNRLNKEASALLNNGKIEQSVQKYHEALKVEGISNELKGMTYHNIVCAYTWDNNIDSILKYSELATACYNVGSYNYKVNKIYYNLYSNNVDEALQILETMDVKDYFVQNTLGSIYLGDNGQEYKDLSKALEHNKNAYALRKNRISEDVLARNYLYLKDFEKSRYHYENLLKMYPGNLEIIFQLGKVEFNGGNIDKADQYFNMILDKRPDFNELIEWYKQNPDEAY